MKINNSNIIRLYIAVSDNKIIHVASGLKQFVHEMKEIDKHVKSKTYYENHFKTNEFYYFQNPQTGKQYTFQKIENQK